MQRLLEDMRTGEFHFDWLLAITTFLFWMRLLVMLRLTSTFGPLIVIMVQMTKDLSIFFVLLAIELIAFSCVGLLSFGSLPEYDSLYTTMIMFFMTAMGDWEIDLYDGLEIGYMQVAGVLFHCTVIVINLLIMVNLVIAIMTDTYAKLSEVQMGLFGAGIIEAIPSYKNNK